MSLGGCASPDVRDIPSAPAAPNEEQTPPQSAGKDQPDTAAAATCDSGALPFSISGAPSEAIVLDTADAKDANLSVKWSFGGDFAEIGSFPLNERTVFGSSTETTEDVASYTASLITPDGCTLLDAPDESTDESFIEPQDGSGNGQQLVWRASRLSYAMPYGVDNWLLYTYRADEGATRLLGSAQALNGTESTPQTGIECVPTANATTAYFATPLFRDDSWKLSVVAFPLTAKDAADTTSVIGEGCYPAATAHGVLFASTRHRSAEQAPWDTLARSEGGIVDEPLVLDDPAGTWALSGVWASDKARAVSFSSARSGESYIGLWNEDFSCALAWIRTRSPAVLGDMNDEWFVFGAGSDVAGDMYAYRLGGDLVKLGEAAGYARPRIAQKNNTVLLPRVTDPGGPVAFDVAVLE